jgi:hypothetical protein
MKTELTKLLNQLSPADFSKVKQLYKMTNGIKGDTVDEFVNNVPNDKTTEGIIKLCKKQLEL